MVAKHKYICGGCGWKFKSQYLPNLCPYCGKQSSVHEDVPSGASDLLKEVEEVDRSIQERERAD